MPNIIKVFFAIVILIVLAVIGLQVTGNSHVVEAVRSTYLQGRTGPGINDHRYFEHRVVEAGNPTPWKYAPTYNAYEMTESDSLLIDTYGTTGWVVAKGGVLVDERYWDNASDSAFSNSFSMAKSITSILMGMAIEDGYVASVDDRASKYLVELQDTDRAEVTIEQLLHMTSGIGFDESYGDPFGFMAKAYYGDELVEKTFEYPQLYPPGTHFHYLGGNTLLLSYIIERTTGKTLSVYASEKLWTPLGAVEDAEWTIDPVSGAERAYCCFYSNAADFARLGELYLCSGNWYGEQLISSDWIADSWKPSGVADASGAAVDFYGYQWWITEWRGREVYYMRGILGQYIFVIPQDEMVIVRLGHERSDERINGVPKDVFSYLELAYRITAQ